MTESIVFVSPDGIRSKPVPAGGEAAAIYRKASWMQEQRHASAEPTFVPAPPPAPELAPVSEMPPVAVASDELEALGLPESLVDVLVEAGYPCVEDLRAASDDDLLAIAGLGTASLEKIRAALEADA